MPNQETTSRPEWRSRSPDEIIWSIFDGDFIAYHRPSGKTHFLNAASYVLITEVLKESCDVDAVAAVFTDEEKGVRSPDVVAGFRSLLEHLEILGLIDRV